MPGHSHDHLGRRPTWAELELAILRVLHGWQYDGRVGACAANSPQEAQLARIYGTDHLDRLRTHRFDEVPDYIIRAELRDLDVLSSELDAAFKRLVDLGKIVFTRRYDHYGGWRLPSGQILVVDGLLETLAMPELAHGWPPGRRSAYVRILIDDDVFEEQRAFDGQECGKCYSLTGKGIEAVPAERNGLAAIPLGLTAQPSMEGVNDQEAGRRIKPSHATAKALYEWAMENIEGAEDMIYAVLFEKLTNDPRCAGEGLPSNADAFARYCRAAGIRRNTPLHKKGATRSVRRASDL